MTNKIDQTIRSLKDSLRELNNIEIVLLQVEIVPHCNDLEEKYQKLHKAGVIMNNTQYLINNKVIEIPDSSDPIVTTMMSITEKEINLIAAMRSVVSQTNKYEVHVITENYLGRHIVTEYYDTFLIDNSVNEIEVSFSNTLSFEKYIELE